MTLTRSTDDRVIAGVCGGIAEYFGWNSSHVRFIFVITGLCSLYLILYFLMPYNDTMQDEDTIY